VTTLYQVNNLEAIQNSPHIAMSETNPPSPDLHSTQSLIPKPPIWRLSSLETLLEYKQALAAVSSHTLEVEPDEAARDVSDGKRFRSTAAEVAFCFSMALTQLLAVSNPSWKHLILY
jgi:hypothetical protein